VSLTNFSQNASSPGCRDFYAELAVSSPAVAETPPVLIHGGMARLSGPG